MLRFSTLLRKHPAARNLKVPICRFSRLLWVTAWSKAPGGTVLWWWCCFFFMLCFRLATSPSDNALILAGFAQKAARGHVDLPALLAALRSMSLGEVAAGSTAPARPSMSTIGSVALLRFLAYRVILICFLSVRLLQSSMLRIRLLLLGPRPLLRLFESPGCPRQRFLVPKVFPPSWRHRRRLLLRLARVVTV